MREFDFCAWCGQLTSGVDAQGDAACLPGHGCLATPGKRRPRNQGRVRGSTNVGVIEVRGVRLTLAEWANQFAISPDALRTRAAQRCRSVEDEIADRLEHGQPKHWRRRAS